MSNDYTHRLYGIEFEQKKDIMMFVINTRTGQLSEHRAQELNANTKLLYTMPPQDIHSIVTLATKEDCEKTYRYIDDMRLQFAREKQRKKLNKLGASNSKKGDDEVEKNTVGKRERKCREENVNSASSQNQNQSRSEGHAQGENQEKERKVVFSDRYQMKHLILYSKETLH